MNRVALDLGFFQLYWYSLLIFVAMLTACFFIFKEAKKRQIDENFLVNLTFNTIIVAIIGARLYYVLFNFGYYKENLLEILEIWNGGLAIHGGLISALLFITYYCKKHKVSIIQITDIVVVGLLIAQAIGRWGNFFNSEAYGQITTYQALKESFIPEPIINGMYILGEYRQPTFLYESVWCFFGFLAALIIRKLYKYLKKGQLTGFYLVWYGIGRLLIESLRVDALLIGPIKIAQVVSVIFIIVGIYLIFRYMGKKSNNPEYLYSYIAPIQPKIVYYK